MFVEPKSPGEALATQTPSLEGFVEWLEKQDPNEKYNYFRCPCALEQYLQTIIGAYGTGGYNYYSNMVFKGRERGVLAGLPRTFGEALQRARAIKR